MEVGWVLGRDTGGIGRGCVGVARRGVSAAGGVGGGVSGWWRQFVSVVWRKRRVGVRERWRGLAESGVDGGECRRFRLVRRTGRGVSE